MRTENKNMQIWLAKNGIKAMPKYISSGSMRGTWRLFGKGKFWGNKELQNKLTALGFVDFDGKPLSDYSGNGGDFSIFPILTNKFTEAAILNDEDNFITNESLLESIEKKDLQAIGKWKSKANSGEVVRIV